MTPISSGARRARPTPLVITLVVATILLTASLFAQTAARTQAVSIETPEVDRVVGPPKNAPIAGAELDRRTKEVASELRCPVCQGLSVWDSPAAMAVNMKHQVGELLARGYDRDQIMDYFESSYGEFVRLDPAMRGVNWLVWLSPLLALAAGGAAIWFVLKKLRGPAGEDAPVPDAADAATYSDELPDDPDLARCVLQVREMAYGWPGGKRPAAEGRTS